MLPPIQLDASSETPLYRQLCDQLRTHIHSGRLGRGHRLPATRELAGLLGLNRATVSSAYELLENEGLLKGHVGRGSFVDGGGGLASGISWDRFEPALTAPTPSLSLGSDGISFATSRPAEELFPLEEFRITCDEVIGGDHAGAILQLGSPAGYQPLRHYLLEEARREGVARANDEIAITSGCQQALDLIQRVLLMPGDTVALEDPIYPGLRSVFASGGARLLGVPTGSQGLDLGALEQILNRERPRALVVTPNFQNPTGATLTLSARQAVLRMAREAHVIVIENDIYGPLRYEGEALPTLKQLDASGDVVLLGSFSKIAFPGLRVGWVIGPQAFVSRLQEAKQRCDLHSDQLSQAVLLRFAESGRLAAHRARVLEAGGLRLCAVLAACQQYLPTGSHYTRPQGGMNLWVRLPEPLDSSELLPRAERANVNYLPGKYFAVSRVESGGLRLSFAGLNPERIREGVSILGGIFAAELERVRAVRRMAPAPALV
ncbi:MAG TPA: PLP-dependent aminotransferase family protein [Bryobacteraceae bacterium]|nr:PLP-dependent aminotransferase family protein [Bryobacteraceae bacterium]